MELEKGMYIRFNGFISKIGHINTSGKGNKYVQFKQPNGLLASTRYENIDKASFNIIDLIEVGDYVNDAFVLDFEILQTGEKAVIVDGLINYGWGQGVIPASEIKEVVTKEQFNSMKYVVERDK